MPALKKSLAPKTWANYLCRTTWLAPLAAFTSLYLWNWFVLEVDGSHAYVNPDWWLWTNCSAVTIRYVVPQICSILGTNSLFLGLIWRYPSLTFAGSVNLLVSLILYAGLSFD